jgi:hypothetical protein
MVKHVGYSVTGRSRGQVTPCVVCTVQVKMRSASFLIDPQNQGQRFISGSASNPLGWFLPVWPQNRLLWVFWFGPQNHQQRFSDLGLKIITMVSWVGHQNQAGYGLSVAPQNRRRMKTARGTHRDLAACFT